MSELGYEFDDLMQRVRALDLNATCELIRLFEPEIRLRIRTWIRLKEPDLRRRFDTMDICQSVMAAFYFRAAAGQFELDDPGKVLNLLVVMARNKLSEQAKHHRAQRRDVRRTRAIDFASGAAAANDSPSRDLVGREILEEFRHHLTDDERAGADLRFQGANWAEIATSLGGTAEGRRKQWSRGVERVARSLGLSDEGEA